MERDYSYLEILSLNEKTGTHRNQFRDHSLIGKFNEKLWLSVTSKYLFCKEDLYIDDWMASGLLFFYL